MDDVSRSSLVDLIQIQAQHLYALCLSLVNIFVILTHSGDVGGQKTLRTYWKNYFEKTDTLIWVVDSTDTARLDDCRDELMKLLLEEVRFIGQSFLRRIH